MKLKNKDKSSRSQSRSARSKYLFGVYPVLRERFKGSYLNLMPPLIKYSSLSCLWKGRVRHVWSAEAEKTAAPKDNRSDRHLSHLRWDSCCLMNIYPRSRGICKIPGTKSSEFYEFQRAVPAVTVSRLHPDASGFHSDFCVPASPKRRRRDFDLTDNNWLTL